MASDSGSVQEERSFDEGRVCGFRGSQQKAAGNVLRHIRRESVRCRKAGENQNTYVPSLGEHTPPCEPVGVIQ